MDTVFIADSIKELCTNNRTVIVGIDGLGGAGKSTISEELLSLLQSDGHHVSLLHIDDFIHPKSVRYNDDFAPWECYYNLQWRYDYLINEIILPLKKGEAICKDIELYDKDNDTYFTQNICLPKGSILIIEGIFLQRDELRDVFDYMIYIDVPEKTRLARALKRDGYIGDSEQIRAKYEERYFPAERFYVKSCNPETKADYTVRSIKWLFFDLGGTIYDESLSDRQRINELLEKSLSDVTAEEFYKQMQISAGAFADSPFTDARRNLGISENVPYSNKKEVLYPDAVEVIKALSEKYSLAILANQPPNTMERLKNDGLYDYFKIILLSECEDLFKPDIRFFEYALSKAGCKAHEAVMIGDRLDNDVFPAKKLGMTTVRIKQGLFAVQEAVSEEYRADYEVGSLKEISELKL